MHDYGCIAPVPRPRCRLSLGIARLQFKALLLEPATAPDKSVAVMCLEARTVKASSKVCYR